MPDPKQLVAQGYDQIAETHAAWASHTRRAEREHYTQLLLNALPPDSAVLELGCGTGLPTTAALAQRFQVTGVDIAARHIALARTHVPQAQFVHADMTQLAFPPESFDAVAAFYSLIHIPRHEQPALLQSIADWLRPQGLLLASMGASSEPGSVEPDWMGTPMYWSHFDSQTNQALLQAAGFSILQAIEETALEDDEPVTFLWVVARK